MDMDACGKLRIPIYSMELDNHDDSKMITHRTHGVIGADANALRINYTLQWIFEKMDFMDIDFDHKLGEGVVVGFNECEICAVERICVWDISALKWRKVLLQIFPDPRGSRFLARTCSFVRWYGYGCAHTW